MIHLPTAYQLLAVRNEPVCDVFHINLAHLALVLLERGGAHQWRTQGGFGCSTPPPEIPKAIKKSCQTQPECENC